MPAFETLCDALDAMRDDPRRLRHVGTGARERELDFAALHARALGLLHHFQRAGAGAGDHIILVLEDNEPLVDAFWACVLGRIVPVPLAAGTTDEHRRKVLRVFESMDAPRVATTATVLERLCTGAEGGAADAAGELRARAVLLDRIDDLSAPGEREPARADDTAFIQYSSGSTNLPKGVVLTHRNLLTNIDGIVATARMTRDDSFLSWMPLTHDMGLIGFHLTPLVLGVDHTIMATDLFVRRPALWLELASRHRATILCSPNFGYRHYLKAYRPERAAELDLSSVRLLFNGAEPISAALAREFCEAMASHGLAANAMYPVYGLAEASLAVSFPPVGRALRELLVDRDSLGVGDEVRVRDARAPGTAGFVGVGSAVEHCEVRITADDRRALAEGRVGHVEIRGDNVCRGFHGGVVDADMPFTGDGWLDTGDLGFFEQGELYITGRAKDMICVNGNNFYPNDLETVAESHPGAEPGRIAVCGTHDEEAATDRLLLFVQHRGDAASFAPLAWDLRTHMGRHTGLEIAEVIPVHRIPKTTSGKVQRFALERAYREGEYAGALAELHAALHAAHADADETTSEITRRLHDICREHLTNKDVGIHDNLLDIGENSLTLAMIFENIDEVWPGQIDITDFFDFPTIAELGAHLESRLAQ